MTKGKTPQQTFTVEHLLEEKKDALAWCYMEPGFRDIHHSPVYDELVRLIHEVQRREREARNEGR